MTTVMNTLKNSHFFQNIVGDTWLRYPTVYAQIHDGNKFVKCLISFGSGFHVETSNRIKDYIEILPISTIQLQFKLSFLLFLSFLKQNYFLFWFSVRDFVIFLKNWQRTLTINDTEPLHFSTYQLILLVIWYFQYRAYLPSVSVLQLGGQKILCGGKQILIIFCWCKCLNWFLFFSVSDAMINFNTPPALLKPIDKGLKEFLKDFFTFFANQFDVENHVISPYYGCLLLRNPTPNDTIGSDNEWYLQMNCWENKKNTMFALTLE